MNLLNSITTWLKQPFGGSSQSAWKWVLFVGFILVVITLWQLVLIHIVGEE